MPGQEDHAIDRGPRTCVAKCREPLNHLRALGDGAQRARGCVVLRMLKRIGEALLDGEWRAFLAGDLGCHPAESSTSLRIANQTYDGSPERGIRFGLAMVAPSGREQ